MLRESIAWQSIGGIVEDYYMVALDAYCWRVMYIIPDKANEDQSGLHVLINISALNGPYTYFKQEDRY